MRCSDLDPLETTARKWEGQRKFLTWGDHRRQPGVRLTPGTAQLGTPSGWRTELRSAPPGAPGSDSSSEPCGDCRSFGKSQQSPRNTPEKGEIYICIHNDRGAWRAAVHGVAKSWI